MFYECQIKELEEIKNCITEKVQTVATAGVEKQEIWDFVMEHHLMGIDRVVPFGSTLDIGLIEGPMVGKDLESIPFLTDHLQLVTSTNHPWANVDTISVFELDKYPFISREKGSGTRVEVEQHLKKAGFSANNLNIIMELGSSSAIKAAVESNLGISILSKWAVQDKVASGMLHSINLKEIDFNRTFQIIYHKKKFKTQASEEFLRFLKSDEIENVVTPR